MQRTKDNRVNIMTKDVSIENWILGGTVFILIFTIGCFVWFQYRMSIIEQYDNKDKMKPLHIDKSSQSGQEEIFHIEINDAVEQGTIRDNSTDIEEMDDIISERNIDKFHSSKSESKKTTTYPFIVECYEQPKCRGKKVTILQTTENLQDSLDRAGFEGSIASVRIVKGPGCTSDGGEVTFYENPNFTGVTLPCGLGPEVIVSEIPDYKAQILSIKIEG